MAIFIKILLLLHIGAGFGSLVLFWLPIFTKKGGNLHRKIGKLYVYFMWVVVITAGILSIKNIFKGYYEAAALLGFLTIATSNPLWNGITILNLKKGLTKNYRTVYLTLQITLAISGALLIAYGFSLTENAFGILMIIFGFLGLSAIPDIYQKIKKPPQKVNWLYEHLSAMVISGIAAYTAFFAFGGRYFFQNLFTGYFEIIPWISPTIIGVFVIKMYKRKYNKKPC